jgi:hypothetical protein
VKIPIPRRAQHGSVDFDIQVTLTARCSPRLTVSFPDGETRILGENERQWQRLLAARASAEATASQVAPATQIAAGHWEARTFESWPGQLAFAGERARLCAAGTTSSVNYSLAVDESGLVTLWAEVPQEVAGARIDVRVWKLVPTDPPAPRPAPAIAVAEPSRPRPPRPAPPRPRDKRESPAPPGERGAIWVPGHWSWEEGAGEWVWTGGYWQPPGPPPPARAEDTSSPPLPGCTFRGGHWQWRDSDGRWIWEPGYWLAPPPREEARGEPPGPGAPWIAGHWVPVRRGGRDTFTWVSGRWDRPPPLPETIPPPPSPGAHWMPGEWREIDGRYRWSPGFYVRGDRTPPPPRPETPPPAPPGGVWLAGYWRSTGSDWDWVPGHYELPPGEGYVWVPDPPGVGLGAAVRGHWELRVRVRP